MALREVEGPAGAPWEPPLRGELDKLVVESELLAGNPLGDPARRPLYVYRPPGVEAGGGEPIPSVYVIQGFTGQGRGVMPFEVATGRLIEEVWERWLEFDPVRMAPYHAGAATSGTSTSGPRPSPPSSTSSGWTTRSSSSTASTAAIDRYPGAIRELLLALT